MPAYATPGAYIEREDRAQGGISRLRTDVAAFVGISKRGPARRPVPVESWKQFQAIFGDVFPLGYLAYVVRAFFENGGRRCFIVRVESDAAQIAAATLTDAATVPVWSIEANSSGTWGNGLGARLLEVRRVGRRALAATADWAVVDAIGGFGRADTVELLQKAGGAVLRELRILSAVDASSGRLTWNHLDPGVRLPSDGPLTLIDPARPFRLETVAYQLQVTGNGRLIRVYNDLALAPRHTRYGPAVINGVAPLFSVDPSRQPGNTSTPNLVAFGKRAKTTAVPEPVRLVELRGAPDLVPTRLSVPPAPLMLAGGVDGLSSLAVSDFVGFDDPADDTDEALLANRRGVAALAEIDEISLVAIPDIHIQPRVIVNVSPPACVPDPCLPSPPLRPGPRLPDHPDLPPRFSPAQIALAVTALVAHCERRADRVALIDAPFDAATRDRLGLAAIRDYRQLFDSTYAALYFPWIEVLDPLPGTRAAVLAIPPSGHVAGQIAATDLRIGVHKAPANLPLVMAERATFAVDETSHGILNNDGINVIRAIPGRGLRIAGARLVSSRSDLRFLNVRRLLLMIERSLEISLHWAVFEGNDWLLRAKLMLLVGSFLRELWARGALMGATADEAYYVRCDDGNNTADSRARGELFIEIGVAASVPFEFVVLRIGRTADSFELTESDNPGGD